MHVLHACLQCLRAWVCHAPVPISAAFGVNLLRLYFNSAPYSCPLYRWTPERLLLDPYAKHVSSRKQWATRDAREQYQTDVRLSASSIILLWSIQAVTRNTRSCNSCCSVALIVSKSFKDKFRFARAKLRGALKLHNKLLFWLLCAVGQCLLRHL